jgi:octaprenyl-diphosphate synthase
VIDTVRSNGGMDYAVSRMNEYKEEALKILNTFPDSEAKTSVAQLIEFTIQRKN